METKKTWKMEWIKQVLFYNLHLMQYRENKVHSADRLFNVFSKH